MAIFDVFSKRQKRTRGEVPEVYKYEEIPQPLRVQVIQILQDRLGNYEIYSEDYLNRYKRVRDLYETLVKILRREYGVLTLLPEQPDAFHKFLNFILKESDYEKVIDAIELGFQAIDENTRSYNYRGETAEHANRKVNEAIEELNIRFQEHGIGYRFAQSHIIRIDSEYIHSAVVKEALKLLHEESYRGANEEFLNAHKHYRHGEFKEALNDSLKAFESTMKTICKRRGWSYDKDKDAANKLIQICFDNSLIPPFWQSHFSSLRSLLESGIPTGRNRLSGHGQGETPRRVPRHIAAYILHMTAASLVMLVESEKSIR